MLTSKNFVAVLIALVILIVVIVQRAGGVCCRAQHILELGPLLVPYKTTPNGYGTYLYPSEQVCCRAQLVLYPRGTLQSHPTDAECNHHIRLPGFICGISKLSPVSVLRFCC